MDIQVGARGRVERVVGASDTAEALGSGSLPVLGTPRLLAWAEAATCAAVASGLPEGRTSVGVEVRLEHAAASALGERVVAEAVVSAVEGRRVVLDVTVVDAAGRVLGRGTVTRVVIDPARFLDRL